MVDGEKIMMGVAKSHISNQWATEVSSWQYVVEHFHEAKLWPSLKSKRITYFLCSWLGENNLKNQILKEVIEN